MRTEKDKNDMRVIKFRGKTINGEWVFGNLSVLKKDFSTVRKGHYISNSVGSPFAFMVRPETVGQFTGLLDKNGKEIYEGDIIEVINSHNNPCRHIVRFSDYRGGYVQYSLKAEDVMNIDCGLLWQQYITDRGKYIIGNIHDNPSLLSE